MCGIYGFFDSGLTLTERQKLIRKMGDSLVHRGPDGCGEFYKSQVSLGMRRLAIIDVDYGHQPFISDDGAFAVVFNGEIYNYKEIRRSLILSGATFRTDSDVEVVLEAYRQWGVAALDHFRGMFSIVIYDEAKGELFLARDRLGIKPLYYFASQGVFVFGSEAKVILKHPKVSKDISPAAIDSYLCLRYVSGPGCLLTKIKKFPAAYYAKVNSHGVKFTNYWSLKGIAKWGGGYLEAQNQFNSMFDEAARVRMISERPVGAFLSGGLDSSAIVASLSKQFAGPLDTFTVGFGLAGDETNRAEQTARALGCSNYTTFVTNENFFDLPKIISHLDEPVGDAIIVPMFALSKLASQHVTVVMAGEGADELLGGYFMHRAMMLSKMYARFVPASIQHLVKHGVGLFPHRLLNLIFDYPGELGQRGKLRLQEYLEICETLGSKSQMEFLIALFTRSERKKLYSSDFYLPADDDFADTNQFVDFNHVLEGHLDHWLPDNILLKQDKISMAHSIEARVPFLDHKLVELVSSFPANYKLNFWSNKRLLRNYLNQTPIASLSRQKKAAFYIPIERYLTQEPLRSIVGDLLSERAVKARGILNWQEVEKMFKQAHSKSGFLQGKQLFSLAMLELWFQEVVDS